MKGYYIRSIIKWLLVAFVIFILFWTATLNHPFKSVSFELLKIQRPEGYLYKGTDLNYKIVFHDDNSGILTLSKKDKNINTIRIEFHWKKIHTRSQETHDILLYGLNFFNSENEFKEGEVLCLNVINGESFLVNKSGTIRFSEIQDI